MTLPRLAAIALLSLFSAVSPAVHAADLLIESVEWATRDADGVVRGRVLKVEDEARATPAQEGHRISWRQVDIEVLESIKGRFPTRLTVAEYNDAAATPAWAGMTGVTWGSPGEEVVLFLDRRSRFGPGYPAPEEGPSGWVVRKHGGPFTTHTSSVVATSARQMRGALEGGRPLTWSEVVPRVRAVAAWNNEGPIVRHVMGLSGETWLVTDDNRYGLIVPLAAPLFAEMRLAVTRAQTLGEKTWALRYVALSRTPENEAVCRRALDDPFTEPWQMSSLAPWSDRRFPVRQRAYETLERWGVKTGRPVLAEPAEWHEPAGRTLVGMGLIALAWPVRWLLAGRGRRPSLVAWSAVVALLVGAVWASSYGWSWSLSWMSGGARYQLASYRGLLRLSWVDDTWRHGPRPNGVVGGIFRPAIQDAADWDLAAVEPGNGRSVFGGRFGAVGRPAPFTWFGQLESAWVGIVPWWWVGGAIGLPSLLWTGLSVRRWDVRRSRRRRELCVNCGYDLRGGGGERCPECGELRP